MKPMSREWPFTTNGYPAGHQTLQTPDPLSCPLQETPEDPLEDVLVEPVWLGLIDL